VSEFIFAHFVECVALVDLLLIAIVAWVVVYRD
jgi:hypothetical protein